MKTIELGSVVSCPVTDGEGENSFRMGTLVEMNSRYATVETEDGEKFKIGKTKVEFVSSPKATKQKAPATSVPKYKDFYDHSDVCPHCNIGLENGLNTDSAQLDAGLPRFDKYEYMCQACNGEFGPLTFNKKNTLARAADYDYEPCTAASGKKSKDNNDSVAQELRGQTLDFAYTRAAEYLEKTETDLRSRYNHLNPGQQRMCLGNLIRGAK